MKKVSVVMPILTPTPFLRAMTEFTIKTLRAHADNDFELVIVEAEGAHFKPNTGFRNPDGVTPPGTDAEHGGEGAPQFDGDGGAQLRVDRYVHFPQKIGIVKEFNAGLDAATGDFIVHTGNDVLAPPRWDTELLRLFEDYKDCGVASVSAFEPGYVIGPNHYQDRAVEGMYSPFMMFRAGERFDEAYQRVYPDSDFVMRVYERGQRAYRTCRAHAHHLVRMTNDRVDATAHNQQLVLDEGLFYQRWGKSPLMMFGIMRAGKWLYGMEHDSLTCEINRHR